MGDAPQNISEPKTNIVEAHVILVFRGRQVFSRMARGRPLILETPQDMLEHGVLIAGIAPHVKQRMNEKMKETIFRSHYGSNQIVVAEIWHDLRTSEDPSLRLSPSENTASGLKKFLVSLFFMTTYPKNSYLVATRFRQCERVSRGEHVWKWIQKIQGLKVKKIVWSEELDLPESAQFAVTVDGVDMQIWEVRHPTLPVDRKYYSNKFKHAALKYELAISVWDGNLVWINGPHRGGKHDLTIFREGLKHMLVDGKMAIADRGYNSSKPDEIRKLATPNRADSKALAGFKARARSRHETFNERIKNFAILSQTFRHDPLLHKAAFEAACVMVQYQIENGAPLFSI